MNFVVASDDVNKIVKNYEQGTRILYLDLFSFPNHSLQSSLNCDHVIGENHVIECFVKITKTMKIF